jgi:hypothetical protein
MAKRGKAKEDIKHNEGFRSGLDFGKSRALHLMKAIMQGFDDAIDDDDVWVEMSERETIAFCTKYMIEAWDEPGDEEKMPDDKPFTDYPSLGSSSPRKFSKADDVDDDVGNDDGSGREKSIEDKFLGDDVVRFPPQ